MAFETYRPSGKFGPAAIPLCVVTGVAVAGAVGWLYQAIIDHVPFFYLNILATMGFGAVIGLAVGYAARAGKCRSVVLAVGIAAVSGVVGNAMCFHYAYDRFMADEIEDWISGAEDTSPEALTWSDEQIAETINGAGDLTEMERKEFIAIAKSGGDLATAKERFPLGDYITLRADAGWTLGRSGSLPLSGFLAYATWVIEFVLIAGFAGLLVMESVSTPFHEGLGVWMEPELLARLPEVDGDALRTAAGEGDNEVLLDPPRKGRSRYSAEYTAFVCEESDYGYLKIDLKWMKAAKKKGKEEEATEKILDRGLVSVEELATLQRTLKRSSKAKHKRGRKAQRNAGGDPAADEAPET